MTKITLPWQPALLPSYLPLSHRRLIFGYLPKNIGVAACRSTRGLQVTFWEISWWLLSSLWSCPSLELHHIGAGFVLSSPEKKLVVIPPLLQRKLILELYKPPSWHYLSELVTALSSPMVTN